ncbi:MAG: hypothetical protein GY749_42050 [Desulfobacteraceae bacterium]|nr:hypothetical protein [Desulfobacteraceae bacterium]
MIQQNTSSEKLAYIKSKSSLTSTDISQIIGASHISVIRWERGDTKPSADMEKRIDKLLNEIKKGFIPNKNSAVLSHVFASRGANKSDYEMPLFRKYYSINMMSIPRKNLLKNLFNNNFLTNDKQIFNDTVINKKNGAITSNKPITGGLSAGKNTYTYDAHTYHTKVPPQGIAEIMKGYLPEGGLILDPFAGSGMTGVAANVLGYDVVLNELSPVACFIADCFNSNIDPAFFQDGVEKLAEELATLRQELYTTICRECGKSTEIHYTVWSYRVQCYACKNEFLLWDHCRKYGKTVREHKILSEFYCPNCNKKIKKSKLSRTIAEPVLLGYKCCSKKQVTHSLIEEDRQLIKLTDSQFKLEKGYYPETELPDGVNLCQPKRHGITSVDKFYTKRNLLAMNYLWRGIHRIDDEKLAKFLSFAFTSLYQRVTKLSEFRFWGGGGSGNTANYNVPFIFNEANVFITFERKAKSIKDHLNTTAQHYKGRYGVRVGSATSMDFLQDNSVDLIFTDPPFGGNINYSEMNFLWESWFGIFTEKKNEAIINRFQRKGIKEYKRLMQLSLNECCRVLRPGHWMLLVFMNSNKKIWEALRTAIIDSGFSLETIEISTSAKVLYHNLYSVP